MEDQYLNTVLGYVAHELDVDVAGLNAQTTLADLGLDGNEVLDFLMKFFFDFRVEYDKTNYVNFIPVEGGFFVRKLYAWLGVKRQAPQIDICMQDLANSLEQKRWCKSLED